MNSSQLWPSPAKLNLFLHITGRRDDGYHNLQSVFQLLDFGDELAISVRQDGIIELQCDNPALRGSDNLVLRAANALAGKTGCKLGATITLRKQLPLGAGLGGGSSNAATTLAALDVLWQLDCDSSELEELGLSLGADVPVFLRGASSWAEGVGEKLQPINLPQRWFVVLNPSVHISTAELFNDRQLTRDCTPITIRGFQEGAATLNVFERVVRQRYPEVENALVTLQEVAESYSDANDLSKNATEPDLTEPVQTELALRETLPRMTGTGSSVFLACGSEALAHKVLDGVYERYEQLAAGTISGFVAKGIDQSPLAAMIDKVRAESSSIERSM